MEAQEGSPRCAEWRRPQEGQVGGRVGVEGSCQKGPAAPAGGQSGTDSWGKVAAALHLFHQYLPCVLGASFDPCPYLSEAAALPCLCFTVTAGFAPEVRAPSCRAVLRAAGAVAAGTLL